MSFLLWLNVVFFSYYLFFKVLKGLGLGKVGYRYIWVILLRVSGKLELRGKYMKGEVVGFLLFYLDICLRFGFFGL